MSHQREIQITEEFDDDLGRFSNYDAYDNTERAIIANQQHIDIRSFVSTAWTTESTMQGLDGDLMSDLLGDQVGSLDDPVTVVDDENWTGAAITVGPDPVRNNWNLLQMTLSAGANIATSLMPDNPVALKRYPLVPGDPGPDGVWPDNIGDTDNYLIVALPGFPLSSVVLNQSYIYFSSAPDGGFSDASQTSFVRFDNTQLPLVNGNCEGRWLRGNVQGDSGLNFKIDNITGVQFRITATGAATFKAGGLRLIKRDWKYLPVDIDTRYKVLRRTVSRTGLTTEPYDSQVPLLWRADVPSSEADPRPVNANIAATFNTGSLTEDNRISVYMRETTQDFWTMLDINGMDMDTLNNEPQPDSGIALWNPRPQTDIERYTQDELNDDTQFTLERTADSLASSYIDFTFQWSSTGGVLLLQNSEGNGYSFNVPGITANSNYIAIFQLEDTKARAVIYPIDGAGNIDTANRVFDSTWIDDDNVFKRRKGRVGWYAQLLDGDAYVDGIRTRGTTFAEQRLLPYESITPVVGAQLFAEYSPDRDLFQGVSARNGATVSFDSGRSVTGQSYKVGVTGPGQGLTSNALLFNDFDEAEIVFNVFVPSTATRAGASLRAYLTNEAGRTIPLTVKGITPDQWSRVRIDLSVLGDSVQTGTYRLVIANASNLTYSFWVDTKVRVFERTVTWSGRAVADDPWRSNDAKWLSFKNEVNRHSGGVQFYQRGNQLQVRGRALRQNAHIGQVKIKPRYAELGRLIFNQPATVPALTTSSTPVLTDLGSRVGQFVIDPAGFSNRVVLHEWSFGDGSIDMGANTHHTYTQTGTYPITLTTTDVYGQRIAQTGDLVIA